MVPSCSRCVTSHSGIMTNAYFFYAAKLHETLQKPISKNLRCLGLTPIMNGFGIKNQRERFVVVVLSLTLQKRKKFPRSGKNFRRMHVTGTLTSHSVHCKCRARFESEIGRFPGLSFERVIGIGEANRIIGDVLEI